MIPGDPKLLGVMNNTKWDELRLEMHALEQSPAWRTLSTEGYFSKADRDWFYHFRLGGYDGILHLDVQIENPEQRELVRAALRKVHVPGEETDEGFRVYGYLQDGQNSDYI